MRDGEKVKALVRRLFYLILGVAETDPNGFQDRRLRPLGHPSSGRR